jgi:hypothetical protein
VKRVLVTVIVILIVTVTGFSYNFNLNNIGGSIAYFPIILQTFSVRGYYHIGFRLTDPWRLGGLEFTQLMLYAGPTLAYSSSGGDTSFEAGISGRLFTGVENLSFPFFGRKFMVAIGLRGSSTYSFADKKLSLPQVSPAISIIDVTKMTDRANYSLFFWPLPVLLGFDLYF